MKLNSLTDNVLYLDSNTNIGVIKCADHKSVILIDTGIDDDTARRAINVLEENNLVPRAIINTHSHADHCGGNAFIQKRTGAEVYAQEFEAPIIEHPFFEPFYLFSGANPPIELQNKFLMAQPSDSVKMIEQDDKALKIENTSVEIVPLPGHTLGQIGVGIDSVLFCADAIFSSQMLSKYKVPLYADWQKAKETLEFLSTADYKWFVPSHDQPSQSLVSLAKTNNAVLTEVERLVLQVTSHRKTSLQILKEIIDYLGIEMKNVSQYHLLEVSIKACLSNLMGSGRISWKIDNNNLVWETSPAQNPEK